jgi:hypothetical protein
MTSTSKRTPRSALGLIALALAGLAFSIAASTAGASHHSSQRLVVRGEATVTEGDDCPAGVCELNLTDGTFRGTPTGTGAYTGTLRLRVVEAFENGEGGVCGPIDGHIVLGAGTPNRLILAISGDSCQDGAGDPTAASFTGLAQFRVKYGTGTYKNARGSGLLTSSEDAADRDRMTLIGRISR